MSREEDLHEGYKIFLAITQEDRGFETAAKELQRKINEAEKEYDIEFLSGPHFRDDPGRSGGGVSFAGQAGVLKKKAFFGTKRPGK